MSGSFLSIINILKSYFSLFSQQIIKNIVSKIIKQFMIVFIAGIMIIIGVIFLSMGFVEVLSLMLAKWAAYLIVGLGLALIGLAIMVTYLINR